MASAVDIRPMTTEEFLQRDAEAPEDVVLELIRGELREYPMTVRTAVHSICVSRFSRELLNWLDEHPERSGDVACGEVGCRIEQDPDTTVGLDVAYFEGVTADLQSGGSRYFDGPPVIAVEVLSPSDTHERLSERIRLLLTAGTRQVWVADPEFRTVTVHRSDAEPQLFAAGATLTGTPELEGFECRVERLFSRVRVGE
ncbi:MAG: Uma2 family endonuclease [Planctomycetota bacterium]|nr:MAG: Uma2 family endonuclease [Planctomycetota bacterium]REK23636.1 MAG: Uma2 family endonuclease [Planctomycetota bacterium]REK31137.1 MAG: Uma2 family endonuclease [Planctomycetota bacterium]